MPKLSLALGIGLILVGVTGYLYTGAASVTALIPAFIGIVFAILGAVGLNPGARKHAMHAAAALAVLGLFGTFNGVLELMSWAGGTVPENQPKTVSLSVSFLLMLVFVILAVRSFIAARRDRIAIPGHDA